LRVSRCRCAGALAALALAAAVAGTAAAPARADGDPASDVLLFQPAFFPYTAPSAGAKAELLGAAAAVRRAGYPIRVAVIQSRQDLGADPELYGNPRLYARFLDAELVSAGYTGALVVVMPQGFGVSAGGRFTNHRRTFVRLPAAPLERALAHVAPPRGNDPDMLTAAGVAGVRALAAAAGHPIPDKVAAPPVTGSATAPRNGSGSSPPVALWAGLGVLAVAAVGMIGIGIRRSRAAGRQP
jgi:hypothetical protein